MLFDSSEGGEFSFGTSWWGTQACARMESRCNPGILQKSFDICPCDPLPLHSSSLKRHWWWWQPVNLCCRLVHTPLAINHSTRDSDHIVDGLLVPPVLLFYPPDLSRSEYTPSHTPNLYLGYILFSGSEEIGLASTFSPNFTKSCVGFLP